MKQQIFDLLFFEIAPALCGLFLLISILFSLITL